MCFQAKFDVVWYPLSFKIFFAPIVDSVYSKMIGRRKTWLITTQYFTGEKPIKYYFSRSIGISNILSHYENPGTLLLLLSFCINNWLGTEDGKTKPNITWLTVVFFLCILSNSVQDIALDAWSLTIFKK